MPDSRRVFGRAAAALAVIARTALDNAERLGQVQVAAILRSR
ncbi:hypothetical protein [Mycolicibacterium porcinum]|nr:hypothetical protein [Mycolicibacterium porcinum]